MKAEAENEERREAQEDCMMRMQQMFMQQMQQMMMMSSGYGPPSFPSLPLSIATSLSQPSTPVPTPDRDSHHKRVTIVSEYSLIIKYMATLV